MKLISDFKLKYDPSNEFTISVNSSGDTTFNTTSKFIFNQTIEAPSESYSSSWNNKNEIVVKNDIWDHFGNNTTTRIIGFNITGNTIGDRINTKILVPFSGNIIGWKMYSSVTTSAEIIVKNNDISISNTSNPELLSEILSESSSLNDWDTIINENDVLSISVVSTNGDTISLQLLMKI